MAVATISGMNQARPARKSMWRFSLRELLLVMLAAAALIGWAMVLYRSRELKPTPFFIKNENWRQDVIEVFQELGEPPFNSAAGTTMHSEGSSAVQRTMVFRLPLSPDKQSEFLTAFQKRVREKLSREGCKPAGEASGSGAHEAVVIGYLKGHVCGTVMICIGKAGERETDVIVTMQEERGSGESFGLEFRD